MICPVAITAGSAIVMPAIVEYEPGDGSHGDAPLGLVMSICVRPVPGTHSLKRPFGAVMSEACGSVSSANVALKIPQNCAVVEFQSTYSPVNSTWPAGHRPA